MAQRVDLDDEIERQASPLARICDQPVEDRLPVLVAGEIVVGDEEMVDALGEIGADDRLDVVGRAIARLAALHVDDRAERTLERAAAPGVETGHEPGGALDGRRRQHRHRRAFDARQIVHEIVERLAARRAQASGALVEPPLGFAREQRDAEACACFRSSGISGSIARQPETWKPPIATWTPAARNGAGDVTARGNWFDCTPTSADEAETAVARDRSGDVFWPDPRIGLVDGDRFRYRHLRPAHAVRGNPARDRATRRANWTGSPSASIE